MSQPVDSDVRPDPTPTEALVEIDRAARRVRANRGWYAAGAIVMAVVLSVSFVALAAWPDRYADWVVAGLLATLAGLALLAWRGRSVPAGLPALGERVVCISAGLAIVAMVLNKLVIPEGFSGWVVVAGLLPGLPYAYVAWRVSRA